MLHTIFAAVYQMQIFSKKKTLHFSPHKHNIIYIFYFFYLRDYVENRYQTCQNLMLYAVKWQETTVPKNLHRLGNTDTLEIDRYGKQFLCLFQCKEKMLLTWKSSSPPNVSPWCSSINTVVHLYKLTHKTRQCLRKVNKTCFYA